jgi:hypothetical protein
MVGQQASVFRAMLTGCFWGPRRFSNDTAQRPLCELERLFASGYGLSNIPEGRAGGLNAVAKAMSERDFCRAAIAAVMLRLPDLPGFSARSAVEAEDRLIKAEATDRFLKIRPLFDSDRHPRWPAGQPDGGEFRPVDGANDNTLLRPISDQSSPGMGHNQGPPLDEPPEVPPERPAVAKVRNVFLRRGAKWLAAAAGRLSGRVGDPRVRAFLLALQATPWLVDEIPSLTSYFDSPRDLKDLQNAADEPADG